MDNYKKKYDEALERARKLKENPQSVFNEYSPKEGDTICDYIFPELKESEDERIRKELIEFVKSRGGFKQEYIAWLEKQGEQSSLNINRECLKGIKRVQEYQDLSDWEKEFDKIASMYAHNKNQEGYNDSWYVKERAAEMLYYAKKELEKQGDSPIKWNKNTEGNKPQVNHSVLMKTFQGISEGEWKGEYWEQYRWAGIVRDSDVLSWMELSDLEKQGKQKPTLRERYKNIAESEWFKKTHEGMSVSDDEKVDNVNKVEPKFKIGDYVVGKYISGYISEVGDDCYLLDYQGFSIDKQDNYHLWTIQDAKDGDVLSNGKMIVIFKHFEEPSYRQHIVAYIGLDIIGNIQITDDTWNLGIDKTKPATKEQRDLLFTKMKEAGYEWDADKKELKKADIELTDFEKSLKHIMIETLECGDTHNLKADAEMLLRFAQKPAWSEEDELHIRELESLVKKAWAIAEHENDKDTIHKMSDLSFFLKTLKPQLKREWGEEDETELINTIIMLKEGASLHFNKKDITKAVNWLKSLIPQSKQKWTLETI